MFKKLSILTLGVFLLALAGCEAPKDRAALEAAQDAAIAEIKSALAAKDADQDKAIARAEAMTEQNRSALRALNDKIDRMFKTISRK
ncbi:MAG: hypothetical protein CMP24_07130 [Rickettsiales bacterium]|nr:hypothetical protein [Rickettsiales bacterium]|tara:strand:- start:710 stop:970 length:261 start_codon:yes stop_codon:yes gene_type:complete